MMTTERYRRKLSYMWWRLANDGYAGPEQLLEDIAVVRRSLEEHRGDRLAPGALARFARRGGPLGLPLGKPHARARPPGGAGAGGARARGVFEAVADVRARFGDRALDTVIVSATTSVEDVVSVLDLTDEPVAVVPLFETIADLDSAAGTVRALLADPRYGARVAERG